MSVKKKASPESIIRDIKRKTRRKFTSEEKIRIVLEGLRGEQSIADLCRREGLHPTLYYKWSKAFLEAGKRQLPLFSACECSLASPSIPRCSLGRLSSRWPLTRPASGKPWRRKEAEVGGMPQATIFHTEGVVGFVGTSLTFSDPPRPFRHRLEHAVHR